ncbi:MAG: ATP-binding cassette domain-containing protein, partial [Candidatus Latescibacteria bacterium]|nr:ATP-binding cassette domain-containing protein [Candidatus Latescibacterota bacterium]
VGLALRQHSGWPEERIRERIDECLSLVDLRGTASLYSSELSGGMKKRVGLARAIAMSPKFLLYDEPTTGLDPITGRAIDRLIVDMQTKLGITSVVVTHDLDSAFFVGDRIAMLHDGIIHFLGTPTEVADSTDPVVKQFVTGEGGSA